MKRERISPTEFEWIMKKNAKVNIFAFAMQARNAYGRGMKEVMVLDAAKSTDELMVMMDKAIEKKDWIAVGSIAAFMYYDNGEEFLKRDRVTDSVIWMKLSSFMSDVQTLLKSVGLKVHKSRIMDVMKAA
jgi:hypothetical protein